MTVEALAGAFLRRIPAGDVMAHVARITRYDRYQASRGIEDAAAYVAECAHALGLADVTLERVPANGEPAWWSFRAPVAWTPTVARLDVRSAGGERLLIDHETQPFSIATYSAPANGVTGRLARVEVPGFRGAIAIVDGDRLLGFIAAPYGGEGPGRIELEPRTPLFAFSVTRPQLAMLESWIDGGATAQATIAIDRSASMPVVSATLPGTSSDGGEVWITSHLCHPRPGANDNASGVAALLGIAAALSRTDRTIRFIAGPEYVATAATLHARRDAPPPAAVINLDMVGEDQRLCASPFVLERSPDILPSPLNAIATEVVREVFAQTSEEHGTWQSIPFMGFSDHALFAGVAPAVQFCHPADRFNHSADDTIDKVSPVEMRRSAAAGAALAHIMATDRERIEAVPEPLSKHDRAIDDEPRVLRRWSGPMNVRAMLEDVSPATRAAVTDLIREDKRNYAMLLNFAIRAGRESGRVGIIEDTSLSWQQPLDDRIAQRLFDALLESRWIELAG